MNRVDDNWCRENKNDKAEQSFLERFQSYASQSIGSLRTLQIVKGFASLFNAMNRTPSPGVARVETTAGNAIRGLAFARTPFATMDAAATVAAVTKDDGVGTVRKIANAVRDVLDAAGGWLYSFILLTNKTTLLGAAQLSDVGTDGLDLLISASDLNQSIQCENKAVGETKRAFAHTTNYLMLRVAKAVISLTLGILAGLAILFASGPLLPAVAMITLGLLGAFVAIRRDLHKHEGVYKVIEFDKPYVAV